MKLNVDGAMFVEQGVLGMGTLIRDDLGEVLAVIFSSISDTPIFVYGASFGFTACIAMGSKSLTVFDLEI